MSIPFSVLNNDNTIPNFGLGTWRAEPTVVGEAVKHAVRLGYRHIDCAALYGNENEIGIALEGLYQEGTVRREDMFITSKLWNDMHARDEVVAACRQTLQDLRTTYLDLYLIHFPVVGVKGGTTKFQCVEQDVLQPSLEETWQGMVDVLKLGLARSIGVSNFSIPKLEKILRSSDVVPAVNQIECHVALQQQQLIAFCKEKGIHVTAYCPLGRPDVNPETAPLNNPIVIQIAQRHGKTPAQVLLRWCTQQGLSVIPKSTKPERLVENMDCFNWNLSDEEVVELKKVPEKRIVIGQHYVGPQYPYKTFQQLWEE